MRFLGAILPVLLVLAPEAAAQVPAEPPASPSQVEIAAQASFGTGYLLALYMAQLAASRTPPSASDIEEAAQQYFVNGAAATSAETAREYFTHGADVTGAPTTGPGAAYFHNGAEVLAYTPAPLAPAPGATAEQTLVRSESNEGDRIASRVAPEAEAPVPEVAAPPPLSSAPPVGPNPTTGLTCDPREIEAAIAIATQFAAVAEPPPAATTGTTLPAAALVSPCLSAPPRVDAATSTPAVGPAPVCGESPSLMSRLALALGGALLGGLVVVLWSQPRLRPVRPRKAG